MDMEKRRVAVITGGSRGIGAAIARQLAKDGIDVALICSSSREAAEAVCQDCRALGVRAEAYSCDIGAFADAKQVVKEIKEAFGTIDILINNAGINRDQLIAMMKEADFDDVIRTNLKGAFHMIRHCTPIFIRNRGGKIVNISSVAGLMGNAGQANYAASKAGLIGLSKSVARELAGKNVTCNVIAPGFIATDMTKEFDSDNPLVASIPLKRMGRPEDVAAAVAFLVSAGGDYITGEVIRVDGGIAM
ncbi:MAG: 3-oxoacyl-[Oscillospiraceae bacterium]|nr:3-oxoacyl-[acyl-carrier-protein] reductase [Oscillospiraceae bacterium]